MIYILENVFIFLTVILCIVIIINFDTKVN